MERYTVKVARCFDLSGALHCQGASILVVCQTTIGYCMPYDGN